MFPFAILKKLFYLFSKKVSLIPVIQFKKKKSHLLHVFPIIIFLPKICGSLHFPPCFIWLIMSSVLTEASDNATSHFFFF